MKSGAVAEPTLVLRSPPAWDRLSRAAFRVRQQYRYAYPTPIHDLRQRLMMLPPEEHGGQRLLQRELRVDGAEDMRMLAQIDRFGNVVYHVSSSAVHEAVEFTAEFTVERFSMAEPLRIAADDDGAEQYLLRIVPATSRPQATQRTRARRIRRPDDGPTSAGTETLK